MSKSLTAGQRALLANTLALRRNRLESQLLTHQHGLTRVDHARELLAADEGDLPQRASEREVDVALSELDLRELQAVREAQQRVHDLDFGDCEDCGQPIPFDRLRIEPQALRCVACESRRETALERKHG